MYSYRVVRPYGRGGSAKSEAQEACAGTRGISACASRAMSAAEPSGSAATPKLQVVTKRPLLPEDPKTCVRIRGSSTSHARHLDDAVFWLYATSAHLFVLSVLVSYIALITLFAGLFCLPIGDDHEYAVTTDAATTFGDAFLFSFQTFSTLGYGALLPQTTWAHFLSVIECIVGLFYVVMMGGIIFSRVSTPSLRIAFTNVAVVCSDRDGADPNLMIRVLNERPSSALLDTSVNLSVVVQSVGMVRTLPLQLVRDRQYILRGVWTLKHTLDANSPLHGLTQANASERLLSVVVFMAGTDEAYMQRVHTWRVYACEDLRFGSVFEDMVEARPEERALVLDVGRLHSIKPDR